MTVKINTTAWRRIRGLVERLGSRQVQVGIFEGQIAKVATVHEFGAPGAGIPERSFMRSALEQGRARLEEIQRRVAGLVASGKMDENKALTVIGIWARDAMKRRINEQPSEWPALKPATVRRKGKRKNKMLINTGQLINSITFKLVGLGAKATDEKSATRSVRSGIGRKRGPKK